MNFADAEDMGPVDKGEYLVVVDEVEYRDAETHEKEYDSLEWRLTITEPGDFEGRKLWFYNSFSPKAMFRMIETFENLGYDVDPEGEFDLDYDEDTMLIIDPELAGIPAIAVVEPSTYNGKPSHSVATLLSADAPAETDNEPEPESEPEPEPEEKPKPRGTAKKTSGTGKKTTARKSGAAKRRFQ